MFFTKDNDLKQLKESKNGVRPIVAALKTHVKNPEVCQYACAAIVNISVADNDIKNEITNCGGIGAVIDAMKEHPDNFDVCKCGCAVLGTLSFGNSNPFFF